MLFSARILAVVLLPIIVAVVVWTTVAFFTWVPLTHWLAALLDSGGSGWSALLAGAGATLLLMLGAVLTVLVAVAVLAMPVIVDAVAARDFAMLERKRGGTFVGSLVNATVAIGVFLPLWLLTLLLLPLPPLYVAASLALNAWLNGRLFRYDALALHADRNELPAVIRQARGRLLALGLVLSPLSLIPFVNLISPIYAGIAFTYLCLDQLAAYRAQGATAITILRN
jgi:CysZ protein